MLMEMVITVLFFGGLGGLIVLGVAFEDYMKWDKIHQLVKRK